MRVLIKIIGLIVGWLWRQKATVSINFKQTLSKKNPPKDTVPPVAPNTTATNDDAASGNIREVHNTYADDTADDLKNTQDESKNTQEVPKTPPLVVVGGTYSRGGFIETMWPVAQYIKTHYHIQPLITITQSAHESRWGDSELTRTANNLFGYTGESWEKAGMPVIHRPTREHINGKWITVNRPFRRYDSWLDSTKDWAENISKRTRYERAYVAAMAGNLALFAVEVWKAGYATDPRYPDKLIDLADSVYTSMRKLGYV